MTLRTGTLLVLAVVVAFAAVVVVVLYGTDTFVSTTSDTAPATRSGEAPVSSTSVSSAGSATQTQPGDGSAADYKTVSANSRVANVSFEVPRDWMTETRHSDDKNTPVAQMRAFLATAHYTDFSAEQLRAMTDVDIANMYFRYIDGYGPIFPNASVIPAGAISYGDWNATQIDVFFEEGSVVERVVARKDFIARACAVIHEQPFCNTAWENTAIQSLSVTIETPEFTPTTGISKENAGGQRYYIAVPGKNATLIVRKQSRGDQAFEQGFARLLATLRFE